MHAAHDILESCLTEYVLASNVPLASVLSLSRLFSFVVRFVRFWEHVQVEVEVSYCKSQHSSVSGCDDDDDDDDDGDDSSDCI